MELSPAGGPSGPKSKSLKRHPVPAYGIVIGNTIRLRYIPLPLQLSIIESWLPHLLLFLVSFAQNLPVSLHTVSFV